MRQHLARWGLLAAGALLIPAVAAAPAAAGAALAPAAPASVEGGAHHDVTTVPISFEVRNVNRTEVDCTADGKTYTVRGHIVAPRGALKHAAGHKATTLYLHGLGFGEFFWRYPGIAGYDFAAAQARVGHISVIVDRLGYDSSDKPPGKDICVGSQADIAHQMVDALREGTYSTKGAHQPAAFDRVVLAGHSLGGLISQTAAYSFDNIDGLIVIAYSDYVVSPLSKKLIKQWSAACKAGGQPAGKGGPGGYAPFAPPDKVEEALFHNVDPQVLAEVKPLLNIDPCGDASSLMPAVKESKANTDSIDVPVLVVTGGADALFPPPAGPKQAAAFTSSPSVTQKTIPNTAHAITAERTRQQFQQTIDTWLTKHAGPHGPIQGGQGGTQGDDSPGLAAAGIALIGLALGATALTRRSRCRNRTT